MHGRLVIDYSWEFDKNQMRRVPKDHYSLLHEYAVGKALEGIGVGKKKEDMKIVVRLEEEQKQITYTGWWECRIRKH